MVGEIFSVQAYHHLLTVVSSMITHKLNPRVYDSLLVLLDAVRLYRVYRWLDTLPLYLYYELLLQEYEMEYIKNCMMMNLSYIMITTVLYFLSSTV